MKDDRSRPEGEKAKAAARNPAARFTSKQAASIAKRYRAYVADPLVARVHSARYRTRLALRNLRRKLIESSLGAQVARPFRRMRDAPLPDVRPSVSIVVVTFNNLTLTKLCLQSVLANTTEADLDVVIVDNASTDGTPAWLAAVAAREPKVRTVLNQQNRGFAAANNQGLTIAGGAVLVLLNNDTVVPPGWLRGLLRTLAAPGVGLVGPVTNSISNEACIPVGYLSLTGMEHFAVRHMADNIDVRFELSMLAMYCIAMRRDVWEQVGPLDEGFGIGMFEDDDYCNRMRQAGLRVVCTAESFVHHFGQASFKALIPTGEYDTIWKRNQEYYEQKWGRWIRPTTN